MTTLTSADGAGEVINARRTESLDAPSILKLVQSSTECLFGRVNVVNLIEKAVLAVTLSNDRDEVLGHAAFFDYPNLTDVDSACWEDWLSKHYATHKCMPLNTLFMHYFVAKPEYSHGCAQEIVRTMFNAVPDLHFCFLVVPTGVFPDSSLADIFQPLKKHEGGKGPENCSVFACYRHDHVPVLHVRNARVEDHDDLVPIFNRQSDMLSHTYGDYFLAELIEAQDDKMKCVVAEIEGTAIGFMSVSTDVNVQLLNECFELGPFHGLRKPHDDDQLTATKTPTPTPPPQPEAELDTEEKPSSGRSGKSSSSCSSQKSGSGHDAPAATGTTDSQEPEDPDMDRVSIKSAGSKEGSKQGSRPSSKGSVKGEEPRVKPRLSDAEGGSGSLLSDQSDLESVKSAASERDVEPEPESSKDATMLVTPKPPTPRANLPKRFVPIYHGNNSAFCIQLFCIDERYEMRSMDFLPKVFELFEDYDFCIITVPHLVPEFPLLQQFVQTQTKYPTFTRDQEYMFRQPVLYERVSPRCPSTLSQELYVFSRPGLFRSVRVRTACSNDYDAVVKLSNVLELHENLLNDLAQFNKARRDDSGMPIQAFVAECLNQVVGVAIIRAEQDIEYIRSHYNIEDFIYFNHHRREEHGHLHHYALNPVFKHFSKHFLKEILRQGHKTCLYYPLYPSYSDIETLEKHSLVAALSDMVPVRARRQIAYPLDILEGNVPSERVVDSKEMFALNHINRKLTLEPKVTINARIVVVGASDTGMAFLETFAFCPHLRFNNLTIISPHGLPGELPADELRDGMLSSSECYSRQEYAQMALRTWVNVVYGKMTAIDRRKKHIVVNYNTLVPYDHMVLCTGNQYQVPSPSGADIADLTTSNELPNPPDRRFMGTPPKNLFINNDVYDSAVALYWLENNLINTDGRALVYGHTLDTFTCVQALLAAGLPGDRITLVEPPLNYETNCFNNRDVEMAVRSVLQDAGVEVHDDCVLARWNDSEDSSTVDVIDMASFTTSTKPIKLNCAAFFSFYKKCVDFEAFKAINDACLVYDGRLVIDANFHTNDVAIRAAGPLTKFQRSYHADQWTHSNFNSKEVGVQLATAMLTLFDPTLEPEPEPPQDLLKLIPMYRSPKIRAALLPGGYHYLHVAKPGLSTPLEACMAQADYGQELITGKPGGDPEYFRLHVNQYLNVEAITCISKKPFPNDNIVCLYGMHERFLNNMMSRFKEGLIKDFYSYFSEAWCLAVFHDRFADFRDEVRELLISRPAANVPALEERVRQLIDEDLTLNKAQRQYLSDSYVDSGAKRAVETRLLSFLTYNYYHLPMYAKPGMV